MDDDYLADRHPKTKYNVKSKQSIKHYQRKCKQDALQSDTMHFSAPGNKAVHIKAKNGETFNHSVCYSVNKAKRWELTATDDFLVDEDENSKIGIWYTTDQQKDVALHAICAQKKNEPIDEVPEEISDIYAEKKLRSSKRGRKVKVDGKRYNTDLHNSHSAEVYEAATASVLITITKKKPLTAISPDNNDYYNDAGNIISKTKKRRKIMCHALQV